MPSNRENPLFSIHVICQRYSLIDLCAPPDLGSPIQSTVSLMDFVYVRVLFTYDDPEYSKGPGLPVILLKPNEIATPTYLPERSWPRKQVGSSKTCLLYPR